MKNLFKLKSSIMYNILWIHSTLCNINKTVLWIINIVFFVIIKISNWCMAFCQHCNHHLHYKTLSIYCINVTTVNISLYFFTCKAVNFFNINTLKSTISKNLLNTIKNSGFSVTAVNLNHVDIRDVDNLKQVMYLILYYTYYT